MEKNELFLKTPRLVLRPFEEADGAALYAMLSDPMTVRFEPYPPFSLEEAEKEAAERAKNPDFSAVCLHDGTVIGSLFFTECAFCGAELAYLFDRRFWGHGYATEAARARITYAFEKTDVRRVVAMCDPENVRSWKLMERIGMHREGRLIKNLPILLI